MKENSEALRLADRLEGRWALHPEMQEAAAELRRQHGEIKSMQAERLRSERRLLDVKAQRDALLEALELLVSYTESCEGLLNASPAGQVLKARAAIKAVEEGK